MDIRWKESSITRKGIQIAALTLLLTASTVAAATTIGERQQVERLIVQADYVGPSVGGQAPTNPRGVTYTLAEDGSSETLWAASEDSLDGGTALWIGDQVDVAAARKYLQDTGLLLDSTDAAAASGVIVCSVWADN